jgi:hypothetical protein
MRGKLEQALRIPVQRATRDQIGDIIAHHRPMFEPVPAASKSQEDIVEIGMPVDQKVGGGGIVHLTHAAFHDRRPRQGRKARGDIGAAGLDQLLAREAFGRIGVHRHSRAGCDRIFQAPLDAAKAPSAADMVMPQGLVRP